MLILLHFVIINLKIQSKICFKIILIYIFSYCFNENYYDIFALWVKYYFLLFKFIIENED